MQFGIDRLIVSAHESGSLELPVIETFLQRFRDEVIAKL